MYHLQRYVELNSLLFVHHFVACSVVSSIAQLFDFEGHLDQNVRQKRVKSPQIKLKDNKHCKRSRSVLVVMYGKMSKASLPPVRQ